MRKRTHIKKVFFSLSVIIVFCFLTVSLLFFFDNILKYSVRRFTDYRFDFKRWNKSIFDKNEILGLEVILQRYNLILTADKADIYLDVKKLLKEKSLSMDLQLEGVKISYFDGNDSHTFSRKSLYSLLVGEQQKFYSINFFFLLDQDSFSISELKADSENIKVYGNCFFSEQGNAADIDIKFAISPYLATILDAEVRDRVLYEEEDGWYSTIINYKGSTALLRALYDFTDLK